MYYSREGAAPVGVAGVQLSVHWPVLHPYTRSHVQPFGRIVELLLLLLNNIPNWASLPHCILQCYGAKRKEPITYCSIFILPLKKMKNHE